MSSAAARVGSVEVDDEVGCEDISDIGIGDDILVVDDSPANLVAIEAALAPLGRKLVSVHSGVEALARLLEQDFALILLDVAMPGITGIETARLIRSRERSRGTPILFVTGMSWQDEAIDEAYAVGGFDFLTKPVRAEVLRAKARVFLKLQERTRALHRQAEELRASQAQLYEHQLHEQRSRFESELLDAKLQQLAAGERRQHELAGIIGNELLNPLQTLQMAFDLLREHPNAGTGERIYSMVEHRLIHVTRLVKVLIDVAQVAAGQLQLRPNTVDLAEIVGRAIGDCRSVIDTRGLQVRFDADDATPPLVVGDPARLLQAITTLIDHAARGTSEGGDLAVTSRVTGGDVVVRVTDSGRGIAPELVPRIFDMFGETAPCGTSALNLGFTLVKRLVELHDGSTRAWSDGVGKGTTFEVRLPLAPQDVELPDAFATQDPEASSPDPLAEPTMRMPALEPTLEPSPVLSPEELAASTHPGNALKC
jgi:signal transduction histidine kinase